MYSGKTIICLLLISAGALAYSQQMQRIPTGLWGGEHINLNVGARLAMVEYDCATGEIEGPLVVDAAGSFNLHGTLTPERGGPVRADETPKARPATYNGSIQGNTMTLTLKVSGEDDSETFTLEKGKPGKLFKCK